MIQPKYYTPTVEDLVWGLEYEYLDDTNEWIKATFNSYIGLIKFMNNIVKVLCRVRIKHLDEDDIIELGWNITNSTFYRMGNYVMQLHEDSRVIISKENTLFDGQCRNKAELKRLMSQLKIM